MTWATFPWSSVGAVVALVTLCLGLLRLAVLWGSLKQHVQTHDMDLAAMRGQTDGVPEEVGLEVSKRYAAVESEASMLRTNLTSLYRRMARMERKQVYRDSRCDTIHGESSQVHDFDAPSDTDETLTLEPPRAKKDSGGA